MSSALTERRACKELHYRELPLRPRRHYGDRWRQHAEECGDFEKDFSMPFSKVLKKALRDFPSIAIDPDVLGGTPRIAGTRIPVYMVLDAVEYNGSIEGALRSYKNLTTEQIKDALHFAGAVLEHPVEHEPEDIA